MCQGAPRTCRCIETQAPSGEGPPHPVREHHAPVGALRQLVQRAIFDGLVSQGAPLTCGSSPPTGLACQRWTSSESCRTWRPEVSASSSLTPPP